MKKRIFVLFAVDIQMQQEVGAVFVESEFFHLSKIIDQGIDVALEGVA